MVLIQFKIFVCATSIVQSLHYTGIVTNRSIYLLDNLLRNFYPLKQHGAAFDIIHITHEEHELSQKYLSN